MRRSFVNWGGKMTQTLEDFFAAWGETDSKARAAILRRVCADSFYYADPNAPDPVTSVDGMNDYLAMFTSHMPGGSAKAAVINPCHSHARVTVDFEKDGAQMMRGQYFADLDGDGRITRMVGFPGMGDGA